MTYFGARYYTDTIGRFTSQDPVILSLGTQDLTYTTNSSLPSFLSDPQLLNSYSYVRNNPLILIDEEGEFLQVVAAVAAYAVRGAVIGALSNIGLQTSINAIQGKPLININMKSVAESAVAGAITSGLGSVANMLGNGKKVVDTVQGVRTITSGSRSNASQQYNWGDLNTLGDHFRRHGADFGAKNPTNYAQKADTWIQQARNNSNIESFVDKRGYTNYFDPNTNITASMNDSGGNATFFKAQDNYHGNGLTAKEYFDMKRVQFGVEGGGGR